MSSRASARSVMSRILVQPALRGVPGGAHALGGSDARHERSAARHAECGHHAPAMSVRKESFGCSFESPRAGPRQPSRLQSEVAMTASHRTRSVRSPAPALLAALTLGLAVSDARAQFARL